MCYRIFKIPKLSDKQISLLAIIAILIPIAIFTFYYATTRVDKLSNFFSRLYDSMLVQVIGWSFILFASLLAFAIVLFFVDYIRSWVKAIRDSQTAKLSGNTEYYKANEYELLKQIEVLDKQSDAISNQIEIIDRLINELERK